MKILRDIVVLFFLIVLGLTINKMTSGSETSDSPESEVVAEDEPETEGNEVGGDENSETLVLTESGNKEETSDQASRFDPQISLVSLGVKDMERSKSFYQDKLGWPVSSASSDELVFIQAGAVVLSLYPMSSSSQTDASEAETKKGIRLSYHANQPESVDSIFSSLKSQNVNIIKNPTKLYWGGYSGSFQDPDGYVWEVTHNPHFKTNAKGEIQLPK